MPTNRKLNLIISKIIYTHRIIYRLHFVFPYMAKKLSQILVIKSLPLIFSIVIRVIIPQLQKLIFFKKIKYITHYQISKISTSFVKMCRSFLAHPLINIFLTTVAHQSGGHWTIFFTAHNS